MRQHRILVLDSDHKNVLAIVRHIGTSKQYEIEAVSHHRSSVAFYSRYVYAKHLVHDPRQYPDEYVNDLLEIIKSKDYLVIIPASYISFQLCSRQRETINRFTHLTIAPYEQICIASNKIDTYRFAEKIGVPYPQIFTINTADDIEKADIPFPCVIKPPIELGKKMVEYIHSKEELVSRYRRMCARNDFKGQLPVVQKYIAGEGAGFFAFYKNGECKNYFMHRRIREYPYTGGVSVVAEAFDNEQVLRDGKKILDELKWEGVAMVEFKKDNETGIYNLMEINAKFWGSLDLALVCGANFPQMLVDDALGKEIKPWQYKHKRFQWLLNGDLFYLLERPWSIFLFLRDLFISRNDIWLCDPLPNLFQLLYIPVYYYKKWFK